MKRLFLFCFSVAAFAQYTPTNIIPVRIDPLSGCKIGVLFRYNFMTGKLWGCRGDNLWHQENGQAGQGVPVGGTVNQVLSKSSSTDFDTHWVNAGTGAGDPSAYTTVTPSATPVFAVTKNTGQTFLLTMAVSVTSSTTTTTGITSSGRPIVTFRICQDSSGSHTFVWPTNVKNAGVIDPTASSCSSQTFIFDGTDFQALGYMLVSGSGIPDAVSFPGSTSGSTKVKATAVASGTVTLPAATDTLVGKDTTDTFTNKTIDTAVAGNHLKVNGVDLSAVSGSGAVCLSVGSLCGGGGGGSQVMAVTVATAAQLWPAGADETGFIMPIGVFGAPSAQLHEGWNQLKVSVGGTAANLCVTFGDADSGQPGDGALDFTMRVNGVDTALMAVVPPGSGAGTYCDNINTATIASGDLVGIKYVNHSASPGPFVNGLTWKFN